MKFSLGLKSGSILNAKDIFLNIPLIGWFNIKENISKNIKKKIKGWAIISIGKLGRALNKNPIEKIDATRAPIIKNSASKKSDFAESSFFTPRF